MGLDVETSCPVGAREVATSDCYLHYDREANSSVQDGAACLGIKPGSWFLISQRDMINQSLLWVAHGSLLWVAVPSTTAEKVFMCDGGTIRAKIPPWRNCPEQLSERICFLREKSSPLLSVRNIDWNIGLCQLCQKPPAALRKEESCG